MALQKSITVANLGITPTYWRVIGVFIDAAQPTARIVLGGYVNAEIRQAGGGHIDQREYVLGAPQFVALASSPAQGPSTFAAIAGPCYDFVKAARRPCEVDPETNEGVLPSGERFAPELVVPIGEQPTVPSEFADAVDV